jgi:hypothetical protein
MKYPMKDRFIVSLVSLVALGCFIQQEGVVAALGMLLFYGMFARLYYVGTRDTPLHRLRRARRRDQTLTRIESQVIAEARQQAHGCWTFPLDGQWRDTHLWRVQAEYLYVMGRRHDADEASLISRRLQALDNNEA